MIAQGYATDASQAVHLKNSQRVNVFFTAAHVSPEYSRTDMNNDCILTFNLNVRYTFRYISVQTAADMHCLRADIVFCINECSPTVPAFTITQLTHAREFWYITALTLLLDTTTYIMLQNTLGFNINSYGALSTQCRSNSIQGLGTTFCNRSVLAQSMNVGHFLALLSVFDSLALVDLSC